MSRATRDDLRWWAGVFGGVLLAAALLYAAAFRLPPPGRVFMGYLLNSGDAWGYQAFSEAYARGGWLIDNPLSDAFHEPAFFNLLWFALGKVRWLTGLPFLTIYYAFGIVAAGAMFWVMLRFCSQFAGEGAAGRFAFLLASFGGVLGLLVAQWTLHVITALLPSQAGNSMVFHLDWSTLPVTAAVTLGTGILFGIFPALRCRSGSRCKEHSGPCAPVQS